MTCIVHRVCRGLFQWCSRAPGVVENQAVEMRHRFGTVEECDTLRVGALDAADA
jgi:hypothetical protein